MGDLRPIDEVRGALKKMEPQFKMVLPDSISPERFARVATTALQNSPDLLNCDRASLFNALMKCATDSLVPDGREAALVRFKNSVAYMPMVFGILKLVRNSGELLTIASHIVYKSDKFKIRIDENGEHVTHEPNLIGERGEMIGAYALARTKDGGVFVEFMNNKQINDVRNVSKAKDGPWASSFYSEMVRKTVVRRLAKRLPMSTDVETVIARDNDFYDLNADKEPVKIKTISEVDNVEEVKAEKDVVEEVRPVKESNPASEKKVVKDEDAELFERAKLAQECLGHIEYLGWSQNDMQAFCNEQFGKYSKALTNDELKQLATKLKEQCHD